MAIKKTSKVVTKQFPVELMDIPGDGKPETWSARRLSGDESRRMWETMNNMGWTTVRSYWLIQAWLSYEDCSLMWVDEETQETGRVFPHKSDATLAAFTEGWDMLDYDMQKWIIEEVVYEANKQWDDRPGRSAVEEYNEDGEKKVT